MPTKKTGNDLRNQRRRAYDKLRIAYEEDRGTRLTAEDVDALMDDTAIKDAAYGTYDDEEEI